MDSTESVKTAKRATVVFVAAGLLGLAAGAGLLLRSPDTPQAAGQEFTCLDTLVDERVTFSLNGAGWAASGLAYCSENAAVFGEGE